MNHDSVVIPWTSLTFLRKLAWYDLFRNRVNLIWCHYWHWFVVSLTPFTLKNFFSDIIDQLHVDTKYGCLFANLLFSIALPFPFKQVFTNSLPLKKRALQFFWYLILNYMTLTLLLLRYKSSTYRKFYIFF